ncbi:XP_028590673.1uncharacterized protein LOC114599482 [Podarcis lilfordi]|uniref:XP_028590673.1uncharacterized protein LOC114599482 n=1 Tax=Podarcis lilfordi TaxID=74358 RepID=A0AA35LM97_9SAUR|nr:XP_028590673.1uncharacterized protein LOC114599482 [Podarcis lilfordi]
MANRGNARTPQSGGALVPVAHGNPQALAQLFSAIQNFYAQCGPPVASTSTIVELSQDCIPDTPPSQQGLAGPSSSTSSATQPGVEPPNRPQTRLQTARAQKSKSSAQKVKPGPQKSKASAQKTRPLRAAPPNASQETIGVPSVFQDAPAQRSPSKGSSSDEELPPQQAASTSNDPAPQDSSSRGRKRKAKRKHVSKKSRRRDTSDSEDETGTSSSEGDSDAPMETYWGEGEETGAPLWIHERRANSHRKTFNGTLEWKDGALVEDVKVSTHLATDFILGNHLSKRKRDKILNGDFIDMFTLLPPAQIKGKGEKKRYYGKKRYRSPRAERTFENWLNGYQVFMGIVLGCYPKRGLHLASYLAHVRRACELAGDEAAISYDEDFRRNASLLSSTRWDQRDNNYWMEHVGPNIEKKTHDQAKPGKVDTKRRKQCWDFNRGNCQRTSCKYLHECDKCLGSHPAINCYKSKQQPFRGGRGHLHQGNRGAPSGASGPAQGSAGNRY